MTSMPQGKFTTYNKLNIKNTQTKSLENSAYSQKKRRKMYCIIFIILSSICITFCAEENKSVELKLPIDNPEVQYFIKEQLAINSATALPRNVTQVYKAQLQVINNERRYTILFELDVDSRFLSNCFMFVRTNSTPTYFYKCSQKIRDVSLFILLYYY